MRPKYIASLILLSLLSLGACSTSGETTGAMFQSALSTKTGSVDANEAASLISEYRRTKGLAAVTVNATLMGIARIHSGRMAAADKMTHVLPGEGSFMQRLTEGGFEPAAAAENVAAGQRTLAEVLEAWRKSTSHNANLLEPNVTGIGIALSIADGGKYKYFWTLVLGAPRQPRADGQMDGPGVGPGIMRPDGVTVQIH